MGQSLVFRCRGHTKAEELRPGEIPTPLRTDHSPATSAKLPVSVAFESTKSQSFKETFKYFNFNMHCMQVSHFKTHMHGNSLKVKSKYIGLGERFFL